jgi:Fe-S-cluster containining protein
MPSPPDGFRCKQCGACCRAYVPVTEQDILRWAIESRDDILRWVSAADCLIHPVIEQGIARCPFLKSAHHGVYVCRIHSTKPAACSRFPRSRQEAERVGCRGYEPA